MTFNNQLTKISCNILKPDPEFQISQTKAGLNVIRYNGIYGPDSVLKILQIITDLIKCCSIAHLFA